jgi:hypothetical protein
VSDYPFNARFMLDGMSNAVLMGISSCFEAEISVFRAGLSFLQCGLP